jgi:hypothetical protein
MNFGSETRKSDHPWVRQREYRPRDRPYGLVPRAQYEAIDGEKSTPKPSRFSLSRTRSRVEKNGRILALTHDGKAHSGFTSGRMDSFSLS